MGMMIFFILLFILGILLFSDRILLQLRFFILLLELVSY